MRIKIDINLKLGRIIKYLILVDLIFFAGWGLIQPIFAVFIIENITGATVVTVGIFAAIFWTIKSTLQLPIARFLDKTPGEKDDFYALVSGFFLVSVSSFLFILVDNIWQLYLVQIVQATALALYAASFPAIFSRHIDQSRISFEWALDSSALGISVAVGGLLGGIIAKTFGFEAVFVLVAILSAASAMVLLLVPDIILPKVKKETDVSPEAMRHPPTPVGR